MPAACYTLSATLDTDRFGPLHSRRRTQLNMACIIVAGYLVRYPLGGQIWNHLQYPLGLRQLGYDVYFFEEFGWPNSCFDPTHNRCSNNPTFGLRMIAPLMERLGLKDRWVYRDAK